MVYNSAVLALIPAELITANKNCKLGSWKRLMKSVFCYNESGCDAEFMNLWDDCESN